MKKILILPTVFAWLAYSLVGHAKCTTNPVLQSDSRFPSTIRGRLIYHAYDDYGDGSSNLFLKDFKTNAVTQLNQGFWNIEDPMNAHFSPNGRSITFMGRQNTRWNIFMWKIGSSLPPVNLSNNTQYTGGTSEDPKFSADGNYIVYKKNGDIALMHLNQSNPELPTVDGSWAITNDSYAIEESMPYFSADGKSVFYSQGAGVTSNIYQINFKFKANQLIVGSPSLIAGRQDVAEFYPIVKGSALFYVGWKDTTNRHDQIYFRTSVLWNSQPVELALNNCNEENSDPAPVDSSYLIFSSTRNDDFYHLYLGNINTGQVWSLNRFGVNQAQKNQLGATYTMMP